MAAGRGRPDPGRDPRRSGAARAVLDLTSDGLWQTAQALGYSGSYLAARDLFQQITTAYQEDKHYGPEHPDTLAAHRSLTYWTGQIDRRSSPAAR